MKHRWVGKVEPEPVSDDELAVFVAAALPGTDVKTLRPLTGGFRNRNYHVHIKAGDRVLRLYSRGDRGAWKEQRLAELVGHEVNTPKLLDILEVGDRVVAIREFVAGKPLHEELHGDNGLSFDVAFAIGQTLANIHRTRFDECGELDASLRVTARYDLSALGIADYVRQTAATGLAAQRLGEDLVGELLRVIERNAKCIDAWRSPPVLTHGDFGPTNLILSDTGAISVLDWEFGCSATPALDFGNLLRPPLETNDVAVRGVYEGYVTSGGRLPSEWRGIAKLVDTLAWVSFASRAHVAEIVLADARARIVDAVTTFGA